MSQHRIRGLAFPIATFVLLVGVAMWIALYILFAYELAREGIIDVIAIFILWTVIVCGSSIAILVMLAKPMLSIIQIDETGISRAFLGRFWKLHIPWDEMAEARFFISVSYQMIFSKTKKLANIPRGRWYKVKDVIFIGLLSKKRYAVIAQYLQQPIVGMPDKIKAQLSRSKNKRN